MWSATLYSYRREEQLSQQRAEAAIELATTHTLESWLLHNTIRRGWALGMQGDDAIGLSLLQHVLSESQSLRGYQAYYLCLLAEVYGQTGQPANGLQTLAKSITIMETEGDQHYKSEAYRLQGELLLRVEDRSLFTTLTPEACFLQSLNIARQQQAKSWELRAATSLSKLWQSQGKRQEAYDLLAPVYNWFTEGFDTADLIDAKALLDKLT
jgi:predicted ATPase